MSRVVPLEREHLPAVADLYQREVRMSSHPPPAGLVPYFERTLLDHPWADPELRSLVFEADDGAVLGFFGCHVRRLLLDGRPIRMVCAGQLVTHPSARRRGVGAILVRDLLGGPQDLSITDGATGEVAAIWERLGGRTRFPESIVWTRVLRPARFAGLALENRGRQRAARLMAPLSEAVDRVARRRSASDSTDSPEELTVPLLLAEADGLAHGARIRPAYDEAYLEWVFREMASVQARGELVRHAVRRQERVVGSYVAYLPHRGLGQVMQIAATARGLDDVLEDLFDHADRRGVSALQGRLEPRLFEALSRRRCLLRYSERALMHSRDAEVQKAVAEDGALLTRMDGEWWMGHHLDPLPST
ncbi:MAG TPA: GNAT family N-acetyltransferase [Thermoleophilaceae bacterium]|nr:GNAT family N-acetyltransferase [Thermoleophilaceae bacterium]